MEEDQADLHIVGEGNGIGPGRPSHRRRGEWKRTRQTFTQERGMEEDQADLDTGEGNGRGPYRPLHRRGGWKRTRQTLTQKEKGMEEDQADLDTEGEGNERGPGRP
ncbi:hypothetical protein ACOMHN_014056 [Nucella lapillus]